MVWAAVCEGEVCFPDSPLEPPTHACFLPHSLHQRKKSLPIVPLHFGSLHHLNKESYSFSKFNQATNQPSTIYSSYSQSWLHKRIIWKKKFFFFKSQQPALYLKLKKHTETNFPIDSLTRLGWRTMRVESKEVGAP